MEKEMQTLPKQTVEVINKVENPELHDMIYRLNHTLVQDLHLNEKDHIKIYNWLKELELYKKIHGPL